MQKKVGWLPLLLMAVFVSAAVSASAQSAYGVRADVPFDFNVGDKTIPAGKITARPVNANDAGTMSIQNFAKGQHAFRMAHKLYSADSSDKAKLVFRKYGDRYYLAQIWIPGYRAWEINKSRSERALEREMRATKHVAKTYDPELVTVAAVTQ
jgi:dienelactone hydrolase